MKAVFSRTRVTGEVTGPSARLDSAHFGGRFQPGPGSANGTIQISGSNHLEADTMRGQLVTRLLPILARRSEDEFNIFNVMHHGTHEKQISNVFAWLLDANGTHKLGDAFQRIFVDEVNRGLGDGRLSIPSGEYSVRQEVNTNTSDPAKGMDIADLVLEGDKAMLVVENYYTSSGHGHCYDNYRTFGARDGKTSVVVMLCGIVNSDEQTDGWEHAAAPISR